MATLRIFRRLDQECNVVSRADCRYITWTRSKSEIWSLLEINQILDFISSSNTTGIQRMLKDHLSDGGEPISSWNLLPSFCLQSMISCLHKCVRVSGKQSWLHSLSSGKWCICQKGTRLHDPWTYVNAGLVKVCMFAPTRSRSAKISMMKNKGGPSDYVVFHMNYTAVWGNDMGTPAGTAFAVVDVAASANPRRWQYESKYNFALVQ